MRRWFSSTFGIIRRQPRHDQQPPQQFYQDSSGFLVGGCPGNFGYFPSQLGGVDFACHGGPLHEGSARRFLHRWRIDALMRIKRCVLVFRLPRPLDRVVSRFESLATTGWHACFSEQFFDEFHQKAPGLRILCYAGDSGYFACEFHDIDLIGHGGPSGEDLHDLLYPSVPYALTRSNVPHPCLWRPQWP